jgi:hypothetical protein
MYWKIISGAAVQSVTGFACWIASIFGACSPKTMCRNVMITNATANEIE